MVLHHHPSPSSRRKLWFPSVKDTGTTAYFPTAWESFRSVSENSTLLFLSFSHKNPPSVHSARAQIWVWDFRGLGRLSNVSRSASELFRQLFWPHRPHFLLWYALQALKLGSNPFKWTQNSGLWWRWRTWTAPGWPTWLYPPRVWTHPKMINFLF